MFANTSLNSNARRALALLVALLGSAAAHAATATVGTVTVSADFGAAFATAAGPQVVETAAGDLPTGTLIILSAPDGFEFDAGGAFTPTPVIVSGAGSAFTLSVDARTATTIIISVTAASTARSRIDFPDLRLRATEPVAAGTTVATVNVTTTDGDLLNVPLININVTAGAPSLLQSTFAAPNSSAPADGATPINMLATIRDVSGNPLAGQLVSFVIAGSVDSAAISARVGAGPLGVLTGLTDAVGQATLILTSTLAQEVDVRLTGPAPVAIGPLFVNFHARDNLRATALTIEQFLPTTTATAFWEVEGIAPLAPYTLQVRLDRPPLGPALGAEDVLLAGPLGSTPAEQAPGAYFSAPLDLRTPLSALPSALRVRNGDLFALDLALAGEAITTDNTVRSGPQTVDLVPTALALTSTTLVAELSYVVIAPAAVPDYTIRFFLDSNLNGIFDSGIDAQVGGDQPGITTPGGPHTASVSFAGIVAGNQAIFARMDVLGAVVEAADEANQLQTIRLDTPDIAANSLRAIPAGGGLIARASYTISDVVPANPFTITIGLDRAVGVDIAALIAPIDVALPGLLTPGVHEVDTSDLIPVLDALSPRIANGDRLVMTLAPVGMPTDVPGNNTASATPFVVDLVATAFVLNESLTGELAYFVDSPAQVEPYQISFFRETNGVAGLQTGPGGDALIGSVAGRTAPGLDTAIQDYVPNPPNPGERVYALLDSGRTVPELADLPPGDVPSGNNLRDATRNDSVDLVANALAVAASETNVTATLSYTVQVPPSVTLDAYTIELGLDTTGDGIADGAPLTTLPISDIDRRRAGLKTAVFTGVRALLDALPIKVKNGDRLVAAIRPPASLLGDNPANNSARPETPFAVDLVAGVLTMTAGEGLIGYKVELRYDVISPAETAPFVIRFGWDRNSNGLIDGADELLTTLPGLARPGAHSTGVIELQDALIPRGIRGNQNIVVLAEISTISEADTVNNRVAQNGLFVLDLVANRLAFPGGTVRTGQDFRAVFDYSVRFNRAPQPLVIAFFVSLNDAAAIDPAADREFARFTLTSEAAVSVGERTLDTTLNIPPALVDRLNFFVKARLDEVAALAETNEDNNIIALANFADIGDSDADGDGLVRSVEAARIEVAGIRRADVNPLSGAPVPPVFSQSSDDNPDTDRDGITDDVERRTGTSAESADSDGDGLDDGDEDANQNGTLDAGETDPRNWDTDNDGLSDFEETSVGFRVSRYAPSSTSGRFNTANVVRIFTNPRAADSDGDGIGDFEEINTYARVITGENDGAYEVSIGLQFIPARIGRAVNKPFPGFRTDPTKADSDDDGLSDREDPAPQLNPIRWGIDPTNADILKDLSDRGLPAPTADRGLALQALLLNFDQDLSGGGDGFLEAPDANGDGFPDFTRYNEQTIEAFFRIDFTNDGTLFDGLDLGGLNRGGADDDEISRFGNFRVIYANNGALRGDGVLDTLDSNGILMPTDNCPNEANADQDDFDRDGLGDACDADIDNDGVPEPLDRVRQGPGAPAQPVGLCGLGVMQAALLAGVGLLAQRSRRDRPAEPRP